MPLAFDAVAIPNDRDRLLRIWRTTTAHTTVGRTDAFLVLPDALADIIVVFDARDLQLIDLVYTGFDLQAIEVALPQHALFVGVQFGPVTYRAAIDIRGSDRLALHLVDWARQMCITSTYAPSVTIDRLIERSCDDLLLTVSRHLERHPHRSGIHEAAREAGSSLRTVERRFLAAAGIRPIDYAQVLRFHRVVRALASSAPDAQLALDCGYADQAHMCREVKRICSLTPGRLAARLAA